MAKGKRTGKGHAAQYAKYKTSNAHDKNAERRLKRALKRSPLNEQIVLALKNIHRTRGTPKTEVWNPTKRRIAMLYKEFMGRVDADIFSSNEKTQAQALTRPGPYSLVRSKTKSQAVDFSIGARLASKGF